MWRAEARNNVASAELKRAAESEHIERTPQGDNLSSPMPTDIQLPPPWPTGKTFRFDELPPLTWLVGPNGTGKSRLLRTLRDHSGLAILKPRLVSTDRLSSARTDESISHIWGSHSAQGLQKSQFERLVNANHRDGSIVGTITLLYQRPDLRIRIEATLSQLLNRYIKLDMTDGRLIPKVRYGTSPEYSMFSDECHGVLELVVLLANIYDNEPQLLLIDEPELHLHPQYQAFVLDEIQRSGKKAVLATHSPSFLSIKTLQELRSVICLHPDFPMPSRYGGEPHIDKEVQEVLPRMTEQHRAFFFAQRPIFVEGYFDAAVIAAIQRAIGVSAEAAGSCLIPSLGKEEAGRYLMLCNSLGKRAVFIFDLDALFDRRLRIGATQNADMALRIASAGHGKYEDLVGQLQRALTSALTKFETVPEDQIPPCLQGLREFMKGHQGADNLDKRRFALLVALAEQPVAIRAVLSADAAAIEGFLNAVLSHLASVDIHVLPGGALENYLPSYVGDRFKVPDEAKRSTSVQEQAWLGIPRPKEEILARYGELGRIIQKLPSRPRVDIRAPLQRELANLLHHLIVAIRVGHVRDKEGVVSVLGEEWKRVANFVSVAELQVQAPTSFSGSLLVGDRFGIGEHLLRFDQHTQTNDPSALVLEKVPRT